MEIPPVSKSTHFPTKPMVLAFSTPQLYSKMVKAASWLLPWFTDRNAPKPNSSHFFLSKQDYFKPYFSEIFFKNSEICGTFL